MRIEKRIGAIVIALLTLGLAAPSAARAQSADLVLCDRLAADPADPDRPADVPGVASIAKADVATALKFCKIASANSRRALFQLGRTYAAGQQMPEAIATWRKAIDKGSTAAMVELGVLYGTGAGGVTKDTEQARKLFARAAEAGNGRGVTNLAAISGGGGPPSRELLAKAADANSAEAQFQLGVMAATGNGAAQDDVAARALFEKAAAQNHPGALEWLGAFTRDGRGGPEDKAAAKAYFTRSAALGNEDAKAALKRMNCPVVMKNKRGEFISDMCF